MKKGLRQSHNYQPVIFYNSSIWIEPENKDTATEESNRLRAEINNLKPYEWKPKTRDLEVDEVNMDGRNGDGIKISVIFKIFFRCHSYIT